MTDQRSLSDRRRNALVLTGVSLAVLALGLYAGRKVIAREVLLGWLRSNGVTAEASVDGFGFRGLSGQVQIGDPRAPDFTAGDAQVSYALTLRGLEVRSVRLSRPILRATLHEGELSLGALDPLIESFMQRPPQPDRAQPRIAIEDGLLLLGTDAGPLRISADAVVEDARLMSLDAIVATTRLKARGLEAQVQRAALSVRTKGDRVDVSGDAALGRLTGVGIAAERARLSFAAQAPYPDLQRRRGDGALSARAELSAASATVNGQSLRDAALTARFNGQAAGWMSDLTVAGSGQAELRAVGVEAGGARLGITRAQAAATDLRWSRQGGDAVSATPKITALVQDLTAGGLEMRQVSTALSGPVSWNASGARFKLEGGAGGRGAWTGLGAPVATDTPDMAAVKRAARGFTVAAPGLTLAMTSQGLQASLSQPARIKPNGGGVAVIRPRGEAPVWGPGGGAFRLTAQGGGLPSITADVSGLRASGDGVSARTAIQAGLSIGPLIGADIDATGRLTIAGGQTRFTGDRCAVVKASRLEFGVNDVTDLSGRFCPSGAPLLTLGGGDWRLQGRAEAVSAAVPSFQVRASDASGQISLGLAGGVLHAEIPRLDGTLADAAAKPRFNPIRIAGEARLARDVWTASLTGRTPGGAALGQASLRHVMASGAGGLTLDTGTLRFEEGGLQPSELSPLAAAIGSPAVGQARFTGRFGWTPGSVVSSGELDIPNLDFESVAGRVTGLSGKIAFTSLAPLITAPGQSLRAESVAAIAPLSGVEAPLGIDAEALTITGGVAQLAGGQVRIETLTLPLTPGAGASGVVLLEGVQLHDIVEASPFGPRMDLDAKVTGRIPFKMEDGRVRITGGDMKAIAPGRLTISREAFTAPDAQGEIASATTPPVPATDTAGPFTDFAYQAMEDLAFDRLDATINSQPDGRMGVLFHIRGRHDPPKHQEIRLSIFELIGRKFMNKPLPLPSGTQVDLTLDTTLNLDQLLDDYADYQQLRSSRAVQP